MLGFLDSIMLLLAFKGIGFPVSGAGEELLPVCVCTISITQASKDTSLQGLGTGLRLLRR